GRTRSGAGPPSASRSPRPAPPRWRCTTCWAARWPSSTTGCSPLVPMRSRGTPPRSRPASTSPASASGTAPRPSGSRGWTERVLLPGLGLGQQRLHDGRVGRLLVVLQERLVDLRGRRGVAGGGVGAAGGHEVVRRRRGRFVRGGGALVEAGSLGVLALLLLDGGLARERARAEDVLARVVALEVGQRLVVALELAEGVGGVEGGGVAGVGRAVLVGDLQEAPAVGRAVERLGVPALLVVGQDQAELLGGGPVALVLPQGVGHGRGDQHEQPGTEADEERAVLLPDRQAPGRRRRELVLAQLVAAAD